MKFIDCESCGKTFSQAGHTTCNSWRQQRSQMWICDKSFSMASTLKKHMTIRHNDNKCEASGKLFSQVGHLRLHIHTVNKGAVIRQQMWILWQIIFSNNLEENVKISLRIFECVQVQKLNKKCT